MRVCTVERDIAGSSWQNRAPVSAVAILFQLPASASVGDPSATRTVYVTVVLLVVLAVAFAALAVWLVRRTRPEPQLLAPLERMETRAWRRQDPAAQRRALDASRPAGARPVHREAAEPAVDTEFAEARPVRGFDDLADVDVETENESETHDDAGDEVAVEDDAAADAVDDHAASVDAADDVDETGADDTGEYETGEVLPGDGFMGRVRKP